MCASRSFAQADGSTSGASPSAPAIEKKQAAERGLTLWALAKRYYQDPNQWPKIYEANKDRLKNPNFIPEGMVLAIPGVGEVVASAETAPAAPETVPAAAPAPAPAAPEPAPAAAPAPAPAAPEAPAPALPAPAPDASAAAPAPSTGPVCGQKGVWGLRMAMGLSVPADPGQIQPQGKLGPSLGVEVSYGVSDRWSLGVSYDYLNLNGSDIRAEPLDLEGLFVLWPQAAVSPVAVVGAGFADMANYPGGGPNLQKPSFKAGVGLRIAYDDVLALDLFLNDHYIPFSTPNATIHAAAFGVGVLYRFSR